MGYTTTRTVGTCTLTGDLARREGGHGHGMHDAGGEARATRKKDSDTRLGLEEGSERSPGGCRDKEMGNNNTEHSLGEGGDYT